jgi:hypothetical protein
LTANQVIIDSKVRMVRIVGTNDKLSADVSQFIKDNVMVTNDSLISNGIVRKPNLIPFESNSMVATTKSYPAVALSLGNQYLGSFDIPSINDSIKKWWKKKNGTFSSLPMCPNIPKPSPTMTDIKIVSADSTQQAIMAQGASDFNDAMAKAAALQQDINANKLADLPSGAPEWVRLFVSIWANTTGYAGNIFIGDITFSDAQNFNRSYIVTKAVNANLVSARTQSETVPYPPKDPKSSTVSKTDPINKVATFRTNYTYQTDKGTSVVFSMWQLNSEAQ